MQYSRTATAQAASSQTKRKKVAKGGQAGRASSGASRKGLPIEDVAGASEVGDVSEFNCEARTPAISELI